MKKRLIVMLALVMSISICACGNKKDENQGTDNTSAESVENTESVTQTDEIQESQTENTEESEAPPLAAGEMEWSDEMEEIKSAVVLALEDRYWPNAGISAQMMETQYGISSDLYDDYLGEHPMITVNVDTMLIIKAKDGQLANLQDAVEAYREKLVNDTLQYPMNIGKIQASRIEVIGDYVCFVMLGADAASSGEGTQEEIITQCGEENELALEVIGGILRQ
ncbi:DUF4358 domain-containing protein [Lachnospiraceae bacterium OttesenSCG-928-D06]|nr:DUF4358 domain-containing protein [Lachnospiraceae bacterium OttesenSCG-928-D06]